MPYFICPNCATRSIDDDRREGLSHQSVGCHRCGFGFLFELLEDYYPPAGAGMVACDRDGRVLAVGRGVFELTGWGEQELMGRDLRTALGLHSQDAKDPVSVTLEWGVRQLDQTLTVRHRAGFTKTVRADFFPAYDDDGGLLASFAPVLDRVPEPDR
jgi:PAS domain S-box-containing protein